ncbi:MAG TPA: CPBP family intramembrane glutamic endopeptidase [Leptolinea sp.]
MTNNVFPIIQSDRKLTILAWIVTILISVLPEIFWMELTGSIPTWLPYLKMGLLAGLALSTLISKPIRPLRNFFIVMIISFGLLELFPHFNFTIPALQKLFGANVFDVRMQAEQTGKLFMAIIMLLLLVILGYKRRDFFLARGDLHKLIQPVNVLGFPKPEPWSNFGLLWSFCIAASLGVIMFLGMRPSGSLLLKLLPILPSVIFYAALNSFNEEMFIRAPMLATLESVGGSVQALWIAAYFFGIAHYFGTPSGILGALASIFMGWILSKAMIETRGLFWSWWIHLLSDIVIFSFLTLSLIR